MFIEIYNIPILGSGKLSIMPRPRGNDWLEDEILALKANNVNVVVSLLTLEEIFELGLTQEKKLCSEHSIEYKSLPIADRGVPPLTQTTIDFIKQLHQELLAGKHIVIHCRMGIGRSGLLAASLLTLNRLLPDAAFETVIAARGCLVPDTEAQRDWVKSFSSLTN